METISQLGRRPLLVVLSGPSGVGKDAVISRMKEMGRPYHFAVTVTTRPRRSGEVDGREYMFVSSGVFEEMRRDGELLEHASVYGNSYGVPKAQVKGALEKGQDVIMKIDVQGAATIKGLVPQGVYVFLAPPSMEELERRLRGRKTETEEALRQRMETALQEMERVFLFEYIVVNTTDALDRTVAKIDAIIQSEKCRLPLRWVAL
ncbi:MAG: guanylate kinase [Chloroflexi bacterium]|nr:guanylate kinase [Chloroflexota bacterium]